MTPQALSERCNIGPRCLQTGQDRLGVLVQKFPRWRQTQARAMAYQQRLTEFFFQSFDLQTKSRLGQGQTHGRPGKTTLAGNFTKATQLMEFHTSKDLQILCSA